MDLFNCIFDMLKRAFKHYSVWVLFPITLLGGALVLYYLILGCIYMLFDLASRELRKELDRGNETAGAIAVAIKYLIVYVIYIAVTIYRLVIKMLMAILYFFAYCVFSISTLFRLGGSPFAFHELDDANNTEENTDKYSCSKDI